MIYVSRDKVQKPRVLALRAARWTSDLLAERDTRKRKRILAKYNHPDVKQALVALFSGKCAYCESKITHVDYGHIEHYRPKGPSPEFAFAWDNLLLACGRCNGPEHKGDRFPEADQDGPILNPCDDNPAEHLSFGFDTETMLASVSPKSGRGATTVAVIGLNRYDLCAYRSSYIKMLYVLASRALQDNGAKALLLEACQDSAEYSAFARQLLVGAMP